MEIMIKSVSEIRTLSARLGEEWEKNKRDLKVKGRSLHRILKIKKQLEEQTQTIGETLTELAFQNNGELQPDGTIAIKEREDQIAASQQMNEYSKERIEMSIEKVQITEDDYIPLDLYECIFDFLEYEEE